VPREADDILKLVKPVLYGGNPKDVRFLYAQVMLTIVRPSIVNFCWTRYKETQNWLVSIANKSVYKKNYFDSETILVVFSTLTLLDEGKWRLMLESFLDTMVHDYLQPQRKPIAKRIEINIRLQELLASLPEEICEELVLLLKSTRAKIDPITFRRLCADILIHRLSLNGSVSSTCGFFGSRVCQDDKVYKYIKSELADNYNTLESMEDLMDLLEMRLTRLAVNSVRKISLQRMADYWLEMTDRPLSVASRRLVRQEEHIEDMDAITLVS